MTAATYPRPVATKPVPGSLKIQRVRSVESMENLLRRWKLAMIKPNPATRGRVGKHNTSHYRLFLLLNAASV